MIISLIYLLIKISYYPILNLIFINFFFILQKTEDIKIRIMVTQDEKKMKMSMPHEINAQRKEPFKITLIIGIAWMLFFIGWILLFSTSFSIYIHGGVFLLSSITSLSFIIIVWFYWLQKIVPQIGLVFLKSIGLFKPILFTLILPFMISILLGIYLIFFADLFSLLQNIAIIIISFLTIIIVISLIWRTTDLSPFQFMKQTTIPFNSLNQNDDLWK